MQRSLSFSPKSLGAKGYVNVFHYTILLIDVSFTTQGLYVRRLKSHLSTEMLASFVNKALLDKRVFYD